MKTLRNLKIEYPTEQEINRSIDIIYDHLPKKRKNLFLKATFALSGYLAVLLIIAAIAIPQITGRLNKSAPKKTENITLMEGVNVSYSENVFIGEIVSKEKAYDNSNVSTYTYQIRSVYDLKGKTKEYEYVTHYNITSASQKSASDLDIPEVNKVYIFVANRDTSTGNFVISEKYDIKQLQGFIPGKPLEEQPEEVKKLLEQFLIALRYPVTYKLSDFFTSNKINDINFRPEFDFQQIPRLDIRFYYINQTYYLYFNNRTSVNYTLVYKDYNGQESHIPIESRNEHIYPVYLANEEVEFYLNDLYIGSFTPKEQDIFISDVTK